MIDFKILLEMNSTEIRDISLYAHGIFRLHYADAAPLYYPSGMMIPDTDQKEYKLAKCDISNNMIRYCFQQNVLGRMMYTWKFLDLWGHPVATNMPGDCMDPYNPPALLGSVSYPTDLLLRDTISYRERPITLKAAAIPFGGKFCADQVTVWNLVDGSVYPLPMTLSRLESVRGYLVKFAKDARHLPQNQWVYLTRYAMMLRAVEYAGTGRVKFRVYNKILDKINRAYYTR